MAHPPTPPASCNDCGACEHCQATDTWLTPRQPVFLPPLEPADAPQEPGDPSARESASEAVLRRDGGR